MKGYMDLTVRDKDGRLIARRSGGNAVMRSGGEILARLFAGTGSGITHMGVGTSDELDVENYAIDALSNEAVGDIAALQGDVEVAIAPDSFNIVPDEVKRVIKVSLRATLPDSAAVGTIREAGLLSVSESGRFLYNRIVIDPVVKGDDHELTMFWEVSFPYGDLQWF
jgi:hypothetical protein